ncbi:unnamed protein product, partial [Iphiclides podalirius]
MQLETFHTQNTTTEPRTLHSAEHSRSASPQKRRATRQSGAARSQWPTYQFLLISTTDSRIIFIRRRIQIGAAFDLAQFGPSSRFALTMGPFMTGPGPLYAHLGGHSDGDTRRFRAARSISRLSVARRRAREMQFVN